MPPFRRFRASLARKWPDFPWISCLRKSTAAGSGRLRIKLPAAAATHMRYDPMMRISVWLCMALWLAGLAPLRAAEPVTQPATFSRAALMADVDVLQQVYEQMHPGLYRYNTPQQMQAHFDELRTALDGERSLEQAYLAFSMFAAKVKCGHTYANFYNQTKATQQALFKDIGHVPFHFRWVDGRMIVTEDFSGRSALPRGSEVLSIDGVPASEVLARLMTIARADGNNDAKRVALLQVQGKDEYETFDIFLPLLLPTAADTRRYEVRGPGADRSAQIALASQTYAQRQAQRPKQSAGDDGDGDRPAWTLDLEDPRRAVLRMPGWALYNSKWDWRAFLQESFATLAARETPALVIDLRGNEGGLDVGQVLLSHLTDKPVPLVEPLELVRYRKVPEALLPYLDTWDPSFKDWGSRVTPHDARFFALSRREADPKAGEIVPKAPRYRGKAFVLIGATNSSATFEFARMVRQTRLATLVGQTTGGNLRGINGGAFFFLRLPHSKIELDLPLIGQFPMFPQADAGIEPDVPVAVTAEDIAAGRDAEMAMVEALLRATP